MRSIKAYSACCGKMPVRQSPPWPSGSACRAAPSITAARLEDTGVIVGYTVRTAPRGEDITAWMSIAVDGHETRRIVTQLMGEPAVVALHDTNGRWDLMAELRVPDLGQMSSVLDRIRQIKGIAATETSIHLKSYKLVG